MTKTTIEKVPSTKITKRHVSKKNRVYKRTYSVKKEA